MTDSGGPSFLNLRSHPFDLLIVLALQLLHQRTAWINLEPLEYISDPKELVVNHIRRELFKRVNQLNKVFRFGLLCKAFTQKALLDVLNDRRLDGKCISCDFVKSCIVLEERILLVGNLDHNFLQFLEVLVLLDDLVVLLALFMSLNTQRKVGLIYDLTLHLHLNEWAGRHGAVVREQVPFAAGWRVQQVELWAPILERAFLSLTHEYYQRQVCNNIDDRDGKHVRRLQDIFG